MEGAESWLIIYLKCVAYFEVARQSLRSLATYDTI